MMGETLNSWYDTGFDTNPKKGCVAKRKHIKEGFVSGKRWNGLKLKCSFFAPQIYFTSLFLLTCPAAENEIVVLGEHPN